MKPPKSVVGTVRVSLLSYIHHSGWGYSLLTTHTGGSPGTSIVAQPLHSQLLLLSSELNRQRLVQWTQVVPLYQSALRNGLR